MGFIDQLWSQHVSRPKESLTYLYRSEIPGVYRGDILNLTKDLKSKFDNDDESVSLADEYEAWKNHLATTTAGGQLVIADSGKALAFIRALIFLVLNYLASIPTAVVSGPVFDELAESVSAIRTLATANTWADSPSMQVDQIAAIPRSVIQQKINPILLVLPDSNYVTLKKITDYLSRMYRSTDPRSLMIRRELAGTWSAPLCGHAQFDESADANTFMRDQNRMFLFELIIQHHSTVFAPPVAGVGTAMAAALQLVQGGLSANGSRANSERSSIIGPPTPPSELAADDQFQLVVHINGSDVWPKLIRVQTSVKQLTRDVLDHLTKHGTDAAAMKRFMGHALFEVIEGDLERQLALGENVFEVVNRWPSQHGHRIVFKSSSCKKLEEKSLSFDQDTNRDEVVVKQGWMYKESGKCSWKRRFFVLKPDFLYYYRDERCLPEKLLGKIAHNGQTVYTTSLSASGPVSHALGETRHQCLTPYSFCIRPVYGSGFDFGMEPGHSAVKYLCVDSEAERTSW